MASSSESLYEIAVELLARSAAILAATATGAPSNQYVAHGPPAYDCCDSLIVHAGAIQYGDFSRGAQGSPRADPRMHLVPIAPLVVTALRCANRQAMPQGGAQVKPAQLASIAADAQKVYRDGWSLFCGLHKMQRDGTLFAGWPCRVFEIDGALPISPEGGCLGWQVSLHVQLDGFDPAGA